MTSLKALLASNSRQGEAECCRKALTLSTGEGPDGRLREVVMQMEEERLASKVSLDKVIKILKNTAKGKK